MSYAIFDLDQTLLPYDTQALFCNYVLRRHPLRRAYLFLFIPAAGLKIARLLSTRVLKRIFHSYLYRFTPEELATLARNFTQDEVLPACYPALLAEVARHLKAGRTLILNSASPQFYVTAIADALGFHHAIGTPLRLVSPMPLMPAIDGPNNKHGAKLTAMRHLLPTELSLPLPDAYAYSDSHADLPLLRFVENAVTIHPDPTLAAVAVAEHWPILLPPRPNATRLRFLTDCFLQSLGLFRASH